MNYEPPLPSRPSPPPFWWGVFFRNANLIILSLPLGHCLIYFPRTPLLYHFFLPLVCLPEFSFLASVVLAGSNLHHTYISIRSHVVRGRMHPSLPPPFSTASLSPTEERCISPPPRRGGGEAMEHPSHLEPPPIIFEEDDGGGFMGVDLLFYVNFPWFSGKTSFQRKHAFII
nr:hypothetical protein [Morchella crassipes]